MAWRSRFWITTSALNLRAGPGVSHRAIGVMSKGTLVCARGDPQPSEGSSWLPISPVEGALRGAQGWADIRWLSACSLSPSEALGIDASYSSLDLVKILRYALRRFGAAPELLVQCMWDGGHIPRVAIRNFQEAIQLQMMVAAYVNPYRIVHHRSYRRRLADPEGVIGQVKQALGEIWDRLIFVAVDVERLIDPPPGVSKDPRHLTLEAAVEMVDKIHRLGKIPVLYTARWFWVGHLKDPQLSEHPEAKALQGCLAWLAQYDGKPSLSSLRADFGPGWKVFGKQFLGSTDAEGGTVDFNVFRVGMLNLAL